MDTCSETFREKSRKSKVILSAKDYWIPILYTRGNLEIRKFGKLPNIAESKSTRVETLKIYSATIDRTTAIFYTCTIRPLHRDSYNKRDDSNSVLLTNERRRAYTYREYTIYNRTMATKLS